LDDGAVAAFTTAGAVRNDGFTADGSQGSGGNHRDLAHWKILLGVGFLELGLGIKALDTLFEQLNEFAKLRVGNFAGVGAGVENPSAFFLANVELYSIHRIIIQSHLAAQPFIFTVFNGEKVGDYAQLLRL
jgi:hypothetical protein